MHHYEVTLTDTFAGEPNYSWVRRADVTMPELTHYGYDGGTNYARANKAYERELMRRAKAVVGLTGIRCKVFRYGDSIEARPRGQNMVLFINFWEE